MTDDRSRRIVFPESTTRRRSRRSFRRLVWLWGASMIVLALATLANVGVTRAVLGGILVLMAVGGVVVLIQRARHRLRHSDHDTKDWIVPGAR